MAPLSRRPRSHAVVRANEVVADQHRVVAIRHAPNHFAVDFGPPVARLVVCAQWLGEARRRDGEERRRKRATGSLCIERVPGFEVEL